MTYTIEELEELLALPRMDIDAFYDNGAYDEAAFEYHRGAYDQRQGYGKQLLAALQENARLTRELDAANARIDPFQTEIARLEAKIAWALAIETYSPASHLSGKQARLVKSGYNAARDEFRKLLGATDDSTPAR